MHTQTAVDPLRIRHGESFRHAKMVEKPFGELDRILQWCRSELGQDWRWQLIETSGANNEPGRYCFYFDSERDYVAFLLHWA